MTSPNPIVSTIIVIFSLQAILLSILLLRKRPIKQSNIFLALVLFFFALMSVNIALINILITYNIFHVFRYVQLELLFGIGPSLYLFTKSITDQEYRITRKEYIHFLPVILEFIFYRTPLYRLGSEGLYQLPVHPFTTIYLMEQWLAIASISVYILLSIRILFKYQNWIKNKYSNLKDKSLSWLRVPVLIYSGFWFGWMILTKIDQYIYDSALKESYFLLTFMGLSIITCWIGFKGYSKTQIELLGFSKALEKAKYKTSNPKKAQAIVALMVNKKPFLNSELDLSKLSELASMNPKMVSSIINHDLNMNFYEFVNKYRVDEFKKRIQNADRDKMTLLGHAFESGFNSKSTFNHIFKKNTGQTPKEFYLKLNN